MLRGGPKRFVRNYVRPPPMPGDAVQTGQVVGASNSPTMHGRRRSAHRTQSLSPLFALQHIDAPEIPGQTQATFPTPERPKNDPGSTTCLELAMLRHAAPGSSVERSCQSIVHLFGGSRDAGRRSPDPGHVSMLKIVFGSGRSSADSGASPGADLGSTLGVACGRCRVDPVVGPASILGRLGVDPMVRRGAGVTGVVSRDSADRAPLDSATRLPQTHR